MRATLTFLRISAGESVRIIRDFSSACDLDIFDVGSFRDMTRLAGAGIVSSVIILGVGYVLHINASGIGKMGP